MLMLNHSQIAADVHAAEQQLMDMIRQDRAEPVQLDQTTSFIDAWHHAVKLLGTPVFVGMALVEGHFAGNPWLTPQQAAVRADVSVDTARRRLGELVHCGRARAARWEGPGRLYRIEPHVAESVMARLASQVPIPRVLPGYG